MGSKVPSVLMRSTLYYLQYNSNLGGRVGFLLGVSEGSVINPPKSPPNRKSTPGCGFTVKAEPAVFKVCGLAIPIVMCPV
jgi:hypothetical protein